jgi:hypothetical protein
VLRVPFRGGGFIGEVVDSDSSVVKSREWGASASHLLVRAGELGEVGDVEHRTLARADELPEAADCGGE